MRASIGGCCYTTGCWKHGAFAAATFRSLLLGPNPVLCFELFEAAHPLRPHAPNENRIQLTNCEPVK